VTARRVLVADDEEDVQVLVSRILKDMGFEVDTASDGEEALSRMAATRPDLLILDLMMPGLDGWGVLARLKEMPDAPPVVLLSARGDYESFRRGIREGASAYVFKPFRFHELLATCQKVLLAKERPVSAPIQERRRDPRRVVIAEVRVLSRERTPIALGELVDLSAGGAQVHLGVKLDAGASVRLALHVPSGPALAVEGVVRWCEPAPRGFAHGIQFTELAAETRKQLEQLLGPAR
jgi:DNA-binding response OmpR family regulator